MSFHLPYASGHVPRVPVRGRSFLAGADHPDVPEALPEAQGIELECPVATLDPSVLADACREAVAERLGALGAALLRGTTLRHRNDFKAFVAAFGYQPHSYVGGIAVRSRDGGTVLEASNEDARITMAPHNEMAYLPDPPRKVVFLCVEAAAVGGEVPISDVREVVDGIDDRILARFAREGVRYHRHMPRKSGTAQIGWEETFGLDDRDEVDALLRQDRVKEVVWLPDDTVSYSYVFDAFRRDPATDRMLWFNQVTELHASYWRNHPLFAPDLPDHRYPATTQWGSGEPIDAELIARLRAALWRRAAAVAMRSGDVLFLDNLYVQHGRFAFGGRRLHLVSLGA